MAKNWLLCCSNPAGSPHSTTTVVYFPVMGSPAAYSVTQAVVQQVVRDTLVVSNLFVQMVTNGITANSVFTFMVNGNNGNNTVTFGASETGTKQDTTHTDSLVAGNLASTKLAPGTGGTSLTWTIMAYQLQHASADVPILGSSAVVSIANSLTRWFSLLGSSELGGIIEATTAYRVRVAGTLSNMRTYVSVNSNTKAGALTSRVNGGAGAQTVSITASGTGSFEDTTNTDSVSAGQTIGMQIATGTKAATSTTFTVCQYKYAATGQIVGSGTGNPTTVPFGVVRYVAFGGKSDGPTATESRAQINGLFSSVFSNMFVRVHDSNLDVAATSDLRKNSSSTALTVSLTGSGIFEDTTHTVNVTSTDAMNFMISAFTATAGDIYISYIGCQLNQPVGWTTIAKVEGVSQANIAKLDGVTKTAIAKLCGVAV